MNCRCTLLCGLFLVSIFTLSCFKGITEYDFTEFLKLTLPRTNGCNWYWLHKLTLARSWRTSVTRISVGSESWLMCCGVYCSKPFASGNACSVNQGESWDTHRGRGASSRGAGANWGAWRASAKSSCRKGCGDHKLLRHRQFTGQGGSTKIAGPLHPLELNRSSQ